MRGSERGNDGQEHPACRVEHSTVAKLGISPSSGAQIERSALVQKLVESPSASFVLISAPVGYGKSTLLAQWHSHQRNTSPGYGDRTHNRPFSAVTLGRGDNDPISFWTAVVRSVGRACPDIDGARWARSLTAPEPDIDNVVLPGLIEEIGTNYSRIILAFDNYQAITEPECHEQVEYLLTHLPPQACLVLATRTDPPLPLARLRAAGDIVELRMGELGFAREEVSQLVRRCTGHRLDGDELDTLVERTEGWPAVVHLAARFLTDQADSATFLRCFGGNNRYVMDYLAEEVLRHLPGEVQRFLARTSILDRFTAQLCDAVTGTTNSADLLDGLERSNLFLVPLDAVRTWYRYHHLFGQALRAQLARTEPDAGANLHQKASAWYERNSHLGEAIEHALAAEDADHAIGLIARHWAQYVYQGKLATVADWLAAFGGERTGQSPLIGVCAAWVAALSGDRLAGQRWLKIAERLGHQGPLPDGMQSIQGAVALHNATFGFGGVTEMLAAARTAADLHTDPMSPWYAQARVALGFSRYLAGDVRAAVHPLEQAVEGAGTFPVLHILALSTLSLVTGDLGRTTQAADLAAAARELVAADGLRESSEVTLAQVAYAAALVRKGHLLRARQELEHAVRVRRTSIGLPPWPTLTALVLLARVVLTLGDRDEARALLGEAADLVAMVPDGAEHIRAGLAEIERRLAGTEYSAAITARLTDREEAVLRVLQGSLPLREVAAQLFVTVNTVKSHTRLIYRKLGVSSRTEAVRRARELGLL
ncbi:MAG: LuxR C-terminal-related transcriptional regulator [Pseudonocardiaceae bacterium]